ncbi:ribonuclease HII [Candidatus Kaiserbacteria bacterium]|nr:MAG: ribonuclease HII [Candidatus Kaiserbacteria bacterium]
MYAMNIRYVIGIDEAGRGPVAGPISVGAVCAPVDTEVMHEYFENGIRDSKKLTPKRRDVLFDWIQEQDNLHYGVGFCSSQMIDTEGIVPATTSALAEALRQAVPTDCSESEVLVLLDGGLKAPKEFVNQKTIIKGDENEVVIALASVMAKVSRDREMEKFSEQYPQYGFAGHKGYGTKAHYEAIKEHGMCDIHRRSFLTRL